MSETTARAALIAEAAEYPTDSAWCGNLIQDLAAALADAERELATALAEASRYNNLYRGALTPAKWGTPPVQPNA